MKLVWHSKLGEDAWFRDILGDVVTDEVDDLDFRFFADDAIHVINNNHTPLGTLTDYFTRCRRDFRNIVLLHGSDEWFSGRYTDYRLFDKVIRTYATWLVRAPGIMTVPLGYPNYLVPPRTRKPAEERALLWSFTGQIKLSRHEMADALRDLAPGRLVDSTEARTLSDEDFRALVADSTFIPCPMGNATNDTWRLYEALEYGCVPIVEHRATLDYLTDLFGPNPIPSFADWRQARAFLETMRTDPHALDALQREVTLWWDDKKAALRRDVGRFLAGPSCNAPLTAFANKVRNRVPAIHEALRLAELSRHQTARSLVHRLRAPGQVLARIRRESF